MNRFGFVRVTSVSIRTAVANPEANASEILRVLDQVRDSDIVLFPELCLTGYTCADLFGQAPFLRGRFGRSVALPGRRQGATATCGCRASRCQLRTACYNCRGGAVERRGPGNRTQAEPSQLQGVLRAPLVSAGRRLASRRRSIFWADASRSESTCSSAARPRRVPVVVASRSARISGCRSRPARSRRRPGRRCCSISRPATRPSARASTARTWSLASRAGASRPTPTPARGLRNRRPTWSSAAIA